MPGLVAIELDVVRGRELVSLQASKFRHWAGQRGGWAGSHRDLASSVGSCPCRRTRRRDRFSRMILHGVDVGKGLGVVVDVVALLRGLVARCPNLLVALLLSATADEEESGSDDDGNTCQNTNDDTSDSTSCNRT